MDHELFKKPLYLFDLPPEILSTLQLKLEHTPSHDAEPSSTSGSSSRDSSPSKSTTCALCRLSFEDVREQRSHVRSDLHGYNLKRKLKSLPSVDEAEFEKLIGDLDESISGSQSSSSDTDSGEDRRKGGSTTVLAELLKKQANISETSGDASPTRRRGAGKPPLLWFSSSALPSNTSLGMYRAMFTQAEQRDEKVLVSKIHEKQLTPKPPPKAAEDEGGVRLPLTMTSPYIFLCMVGGGHFAAMIVSLAPKLGKKQGIEERQASVLAHKTFHRYTTRKKQGGAQSTSDAAKGAAHSAGSSLRRYNEAELTKEIRELLGEWKGMIDGAQLLFIRASGTSNRRTLFGPYEGQVFRQDDPRIRGFPFSTRRATQAELMRSFVELTRVKVSTIDEAAVAAAKAKADEEARAQEAAAATKAQAAAERIAPKRDPQEEAALLHTSQIEAMIRRSKAPALLSYLSNNDISPDFQLYPLHSHHHAPTPLHLAASTNSPALVIALLTKARADPTLTNSEGRTAFEVAGDRATRDAFRLARSELGENKWAWDDGARVPEPLTKEEVEQRAQREKVEEANVEDARRKAEVEKLREEDRRKEEERRKAGDNRREKMMGKGNPIGANRPMSAEERREEEARGLAPDVRMRLERERRARAAEERMRRMQRGGA